MILPSEATVPADPRAMTAKTHSLTRAATGLGWIAAISLALSPLPLHAATNAPDIDGDGVPNIVDPDIDADGIPNALDDNINGGIARTGPYVGRYIGLHLSNDNPSNKDIDADNLADDSLGETDIDGDGMTDNDALELDTDSDRRADTSPDELDIDGDGRMDNSNSEDDIDGDSLDDDDIVESDIDGDNSSDTMDSDIDGDSLSNSAVSEDDIDGDGRLNTDADENDADGDGYKNRDDGDDDNDGVNDEDDDDHHNEIDEDWVHNDLTPTAAALNHSDCRVEIRRMANGVTVLNVDAGDCNAGTYDIRVDGVIRATLVLYGSSGNASGERKFKTNGTGDYLPLNFDPAGKSISVELSGTPYFTGTIPVPPDAPPVDDNEPPTTSTASQDLTPASGVSPEASANVLVKFGLVGVIEIEIEVEEIPADTYDITIDGILRGTLVITQNGEELEGHRHFEVIPDEPDEFLLDFPVTGKSVVISKSGATWFSGTIPTAE